VRHNKTAVSNDCIEHSNPRPLLRANIEPTSLVSRVSKSGFIKWRRHNLFISSALKHEYVEIEPCSEGRWTVAWGTILLGEIDEHRLDHGLIKQRVRRSASEVSVISFR